MPKQITINRRTMNLNIKNLVICTLLFSSFACNLHTPKDVRDTLELMTPENKHKFEKVFKEFEQPQDSLKLKAAFFLVTNMNGLGSYKGRQIEDYNQIFTLLSNKPADYRENLPWYSDDLVSLFD
jgi:hypothetical protein